MPADKFVPVDSLAYQDQGIVSRMLLRSAAGSVTLFAFDQGQELSEHTVSHGALIHILEGTARISIAGQTSVLATGEMILLPANIPHAVEAPTRFKMTLTMIR